MKQYEYEIIRMRRGIREGIFKDEHDKKLLNLLTQMGEKGWELKNLTVWTRDHILIFCREKQQGVR